MKRKLIQLIIAVGMLILSGFGYAAEDIDALRKAAGQGVPQDFNEVVKYSEAKMDSPTIKEMLKRDFGMELNISGGYGQSVEDPIIVLSTSPTDTLRIENNVLRGIGEGRGIFWRTVTTLPISSDKKNLVQKKIETKEVQKDQVITQIENYYFLRTNIQQTQDDLINDIAYVDSAIGLSMPYEISWLHFNGQHTDYQKQDSNLGYSLGYHAPGINVTVYIYPVGNHQMTHSSELKKTISEVKRVHGENAIAHDWGGRVEGNKDFSLYFFIPEYNKETVSFVFVQIYNNHFIKLRGTFIDDKILRKISEDFINQMFLLTRTIN